MKKNSYLFIIIFSTFISTSIMSYHGIFLSNSHKYVQGKLLEEEVDQNKEHIKSIHEIHGDNAQIVNESHEMMSNDNAYIESNKLPEKETNNNYKNEEKNSSNDINEELSSKDVEKDNNQAELNSVEYLPIETDNTESYYEYEKEKEQSVFKVSAGKILGSLTASEKIRLLYVSMNLGREEYKQVEKYLYAKDAEDGVLKALKLLRASLSEKEYEKIRKIAGRFIDMDIAEELK